MQKMSLERFNQIKARTKEISDIDEKIENEEIELTEEEEEKFQEELETLNAEIHSSDLSDIPFEKYQGFHDLGFDFSGTRANLDFKIIDISISRYNTISLKGCTIRNFDFEKQRYDDDSFDEEFKSKHPENFLSKEVPADVRQRYYGRMLKLGDVIRYDFYGEISGTRVLGNVPSFFEKVSIDVAKNIDHEICKNYELMYELISKMKAFDGEVTKDVLESLMQESVEKYLSSSYISVNDYNEIIKIPKVREIIPTEKIIDFSKDEELGKEFLKRNLSLRNITDNLELFRGKKFIQNLDEYRWYPEIYDVITEEKLYFIFDNYPDIADGLIKHRKELFRIVREIDPERTEEENSKEIQSVVIELLNDEEDLDPEVEKVLERYYSLESLASRLNENIKYEFDIIMKYTTPEKIASYNIPMRLFKDDNMISLFYRYGLETVMEFDKANGNIFSKDNFALAKKLNTYYFHYAVNEHNPNRTIYCRTHETDDYNAPFEMNDFEEAVRRMIVIGPTDYNYSSEQPIDFRNFSESFKQKNSRMFLDESAPEELKDKFYSKTLEIGDLSEHPDWGSFFEGKDFEIGMNMPKIWYKDPTEYNYYTFLSVLKMIESSENNILRFLNDNSKTIKLLEFYETTTNKEFENSFETIHNLDEFKQQMENDLENKILSGILPYGEPYIPDFLKENHPELVLSEDAPEELKMKFYSLYYKPNDNYNKAEQQKISLNDLVNEEYSPFLVGKSFDLLKNADDVKILLKFLIQKQLKIYIRLIQRHLKFIVLILKVQMF